MQLVRKPGRSRLIDRTQEAPVREREALKQQLPEGYITVAQWCRQNSVRQSKMMSRIHSCKQPYIYVRGHYCIPKGATL
jgi:hypothetical protein